MKRYLPLLAAAFLFTAFSAAEPVKAELNINIGIGIPAKKVKVIDPPVVVVIPGTYVYIAPDLDEDIFFYRGHWWKSNGRRWYRSDEFGGPWIFISIERMPRALVHLPERYRDLPPGLERMPPGHVKKHWKQWEDERHWESRHEWKEHKREHREHKEHKKHGRD